MGREDKRVQRTYRTPQKISVKRRNFLILILGGILTKSAWDILLPLLPPHILKHTGSEALTGIVMGSASLLTLIFRQRLGILIRKNGAKRFILTGLILNAAGTLLFPHSSTFLSLLFSRTLQGSGLILFFFASLNMVSMIVPEKRRGELFGIYTLVFIFPLLFAPLLGSFLSERYSFTLITVFSALMMLAAFLLTLSLVDAPGKKTIREKSGGNIHIKKIIPYLMIIFFLIFADAGIMSFLPLAAEKEAIRDFSLFFTFFAVSTILTRVIFGRIFDRRSRKILVSAGLLASALGVFMISLLTLPALIISAVIYGAGFGVADSNMLPLLMKNFGRDSEQTAVTVYSITFDSAYLLSPPILGLIAGVSSFKLMFLLASALIFSASVLFILSDREKGKTG